MAKNWNRYEPTAARPRGKAGGSVRPKSVTIDRFARQEKRQILAWIRADDACGC